MNILAIDTSCDETSAAVVCNRRVLSHVEYSQIVLHQKWGGVVPSIAKRAHEQRIDWVVNKALRKARIKPKSIGSNGTIGTDDADVAIDAIAVTYGPGLAIALEVGIRKAKHLASTLDKPLIAVNHMEGHLYSPFIQNSRGNPKRTFGFPFIGLLVSGGHTELVLFKDHLTYEVIGETRDDAVGEALDKAARILGFGYPGGAIIERLAKEVKNVDAYHFTQPMVGSGNLAFSFSGLKTAFLYKVRTMSESQKNDQISALASSFQEAAFQTIMKKTKSAIKETGIKNIIMGGGVGVNQRLRYLIGTMVKKQGGTVRYPPYTYLNFDNAAMIGLVGGIRAERGFFIKDQKDLDRRPRLSLS